jgi:hypothetical protein
MCGIFAWYINLFVRAILIKTWIAGVEILGIEPVGSQAESFAKTLIVDDFTLSQELNRITYIGVIGKAENVVIGGTCFLFCRKIFVKVGDNIAFGLEISCGKWRT